MDLLRRLFGKMHSEADLVVNDGDGRNSREEERERRLQELQQREHDATNRLHILEWQTDVRSRRYAEEQKEKEKS